MCVCVFLFCCVFVVLAYSMLCVCVVCVGVIYIVVCVCYIVCCFLLFWGLGTPAIGSGSMRIEFSIKQQPGTPIMRSLSVHFWFFESKIN